MRFVMLVPRSLDPVARGRKMPLPEPRPSEKIAKLFPPTDPSKDKPKEPSDIVKPASAPVAQAAEKIPLPAARPVIDSERAAPRQRRRHRDQP
jgi:membrane-bound lytic murein transglycosylase A